MKVAEVVVKILEDEGIRVAFGIPGAAINPVYGFLKNSKIKHYVARHEEGAVHAADGHFRASGKLAMAICTSGPGATNFVTGLYTAYADSIPLIAITGNAAATLFGKDAFQCVDIAEISKTVAKKTWCITNPAETPKIMREAFRTACSGRPGPVLIDLPLDVQMVDIDYDPSKDSPLLWTRPTPTPAVISKAMDMIQESKAPIMILGGGVILSDATNDFRALAEYLQIPVIMTYMGKGGLPYDHPLSAGHAGIQVGGPIGNKTFLEADLVIGVGCRFTDRHTGKLDVYRGNRKFIHIDIEPTQLGKVFAPTLGIVSDAKAALVALLDEAKKRGYHPQPSPRVKQLPECRKAMRRKVELEDVPIRPHRVFSELNKFFPPNTIFTAGCGITQIWSGQLQEIELPRRYLPSGGAGTLGYEVPAALGAKVACPDDPVVAVAGDAGFLFQGESLGMAGQHGIPIIIVIVNNGNLGLIRQNQKYAYNYEHGIRLRYGQEEHKILPDLVKYTEAFGGKGERVFDAKELPAAFERALKSKTFYLIDVIVATDADCSMGPAIDAVKEFV
ncbi:MAG: thiamine pyrophosphate-dependent enzyme [Candidatus Korobacteraceae bacterium]